jgi:putative ABC transport system substrate-binding protein
MKRRAFITLLGGASAWPIMARAQQPAMPVVGVLYGVSAAKWTGPMGGFHRGLGETGYVEGSNVAIEYRWADGEYDRMPAMAADLVKRNVAVILVGGYLPGVRAVMAATRTIPIVFTTNSDPVANGIVASLNHPGGNVTGVTGIGGELMPKRLEVLHELIPTATKFAGLVHMLPVVLGSRESVAAGMLMYYGANFVDFYRQAGIYVGRILKGEKPADLPVVQPTKFDLVINLTTAKALGLKIPESFLLRADEVIE